METRGEGRGAAWALGRRVDLGPVDGSVAIDKARVAKSGGRYLWTVRL